MTHRRETSSAYRLTSSGLQVTVKAKPATAKERTLRFVEVADGAQALELSVKAAPQDGKANAALCERLAAFFDVSASRVVLLRGGKARLKIIHIEGDPAALEEKIKTLA